MMLEKRKNLLNSQPSVREEGNKNNFEKVFLWQTEEGNITLSMRVSLKETKELGKFYLVTADLNTYDIKGQGRFIWNYLTSQLDILAKQTGLKVLHEANPNQYSSYLMENDPRYKKRQSGLYYALY